MSRRSGVQRTVPFRGFARGIPIIGEEKQPEPQAQPKGRFFYHVPVLIHRGQALEASSFEMNDVERLNGVAFLTIVREYEASVQKHDAESAAKRPALVRWLTTYRRRPLARVVALQPVFLGFVVEAEPEAAAPAEEAAPSDVA